MTMALTQALRDWHPTAAEVERIVAEMRPIIQDFARRARELQQKD